MDYININNNLADLIGEITQGDQWPLQGSPLHQDIRIEEVHSCRDGLQVYIEPTLEDYNKKKDEIGLE